MKNIECNVGGSSTAGSPGATAATQLPPTPPVGPQSPSLPARTQATNQKQVSLLCGPIGNS